MNKGLKSLWGWIKRVVVAKRGCRLGFVVGQTNVMPDSLFAMQVSSLRASPIHSPPLASHGADFANLVVAIHLLAIIARRLKNRCEHSGYNKWHGWFGHHQGGQNKT